ncbi:MAG: hypothetical protein RL758_13 [Pseudomonadota bacterium]|jgi:hypothetical protein
MPRSTKPRKKYRPRYAEGTLPITIRHSRAADTALQLVPHSELEKLRDGTADEVTVNTLAFRLDWGYVMAGEVFDTPEARTITERGLAAIRAVKERHARLGKYGATGDEFHAMGDTLNATNDMQLQATRREQRDAVHLLNLINDHKQQESKA